MSTLTGTEIITADGALISSGKPVRVYLATWASGATAGVLQLFNNTSITGTPLFSGTGTAQRTAVQSFGENGMLFPSGCYVDIGVSTQAVLECRLEL